MSGSQRRNGNSNPVLKKRIFSPTNSFLLICSHSSQFTDMEMSANVVETSNTRGDDEQNGANRENHILEAQSANVNSLGIHVRTCPTASANFPSFATLHSRMVTFKYWPTGLRPLVPDHLARAGFFYTGTGDHVRCFHCGGSLGNWERSDDPWKEHCRWFPLCGFLKAVMGVDFIEGIKIRHQTSIREIDHSVNGEQPSEQSSNEEANSGEPRASDSSRLSQLASPEDQPSDLTCKICFLNKSCILFLPCGHLFTCPSCAERLYSCAVCCKPIQATVKAFFS